MRKEYQNLDIRVGEYRIMSDQWSVWIEKEDKPKKTPNTKHKTITRRVTGYHTDWGSLMKSFIDYASRAAHANTAAGLVQKIGKARNDAIRIIDAYLAEKGIK